MLYTILYSLVLLVIKQQRNNEQKQVERKNSNCLFENHKRRKTDCYKPNQYIYVCVYMCVCVRERERERERVCVCVCV